ncbi:MAG: V-type ATP synthase subunit E [Candidatus Thorarchaeota archaeon]
MNDKEFNPEITKKIEENTEKLLKKILEEQKRAIDEINAEAEEKLKNITEGILEDAKKNAEAEFSKEKAKQELELRLKITKFRDELVDNFFEKAVEKIKSLTETKEYEKSLEKLLFEGGVTLKQPEIIVHHRNQDKKILTKQFLDNVSNRLKNENNIETKYLLSKKPIDCLGGIKLETPDGKISVNNTYEKRIERLSVSLKRELSLMLTQEQE